MKRKGTTIIELLSAMIIITVGLVAVMRLIMVLNQEARAITYRNEAKLIAKANIENAESMAVRNFESVTSTSWNFENENPIYSDLGFTFSKDYFVKRDVEYVVLEQASSDSADLPYRIRGMVDLNNDGYDDYTGQGYDMKRITITVAWADSNKKVTKTDMVNALVSGNNSFYDQNRVRFFNLSTIVSSGQPFDQACCDIPGVEYIEIIAGNTPIDYKNSPIEVSTEITVRAALQNECPSKLPYLLLRYWYYGQTSANAKEIEMKYAGNLNYYVGTIPGADVKNADFASGYPDSYTCSEEEGYVEPFDMFVQVYTRDDFVGENCPFPIRESFSDSFPLNVSDTEPPTISDYTSRIISENCDGLILATILDGANGPAGIKEAVAYITIVRNGIKDTTEYEATPLFLLNPPPEDGRFMWQIPQELIANWSKESQDFLPYDNEHDLFYRIAAKDNCGNTAATSIDDESTYIVITEEDMKPPQIVLNYEDQGFEDCVPPNEPINISFDVIDECKIGEASFFLNDIQYIAYQFIDPGENWVKIREDWPNSYNNVNDISFRATGTDKTGLMAYAPPLADPPNIIHFQNALDFATGASDPYLVDVTLEGDANDTVAIRLYNERNGEIWLDGMYMKEPAYKNICLTTGDTSVAFPYLDSVTLQVIGGDGERRERIWYYEDNDPTPGTRDRGPIEIKFDRTNPENLLIRPYDEVFIYLHYRDRTTDQYFPSQPFDMSECDFELILYSDQSKEYKCNNTLAFSTKSFGFNYPPVANAGSNKVIWQDYPLRFDGTMSNDCDHAKTDLTYLWMYERGVLGNDAVITRIFTLEDWDYFADETIADTEPVIFSVTLRVTDPAGAWDEDTAIVKLIPGIPPDNSPPRIVSVQCSVPDPTSKPYQVVLDIEIEDDDPSDNAWDYWVDFTGDGNADKQALQLESKTWSTNYEYSRPAANNPNVAYSVKIRVTDPKGDYDEYTTMQINCTRTAQSGYCECQ